jgi:hypothetical protein
VNPWHDLEARSTAAAADAAVIERGLLALARNDDMVWWRPIAPWGCGW